MKRPRKSNMVSWAPGPNLCQVKLFLSEDCPSKVGQKSQDNLQAKTSTMLPSSTNECNDFPPGFEGNYFLNQSKAELSHISQIKWECPPLFAFNYHWRVAAGEESREKGDQKLREMRVLEAVYPRLSAIPPSPSVSFQVEEEDYDDNLTPLIPIIPIEEEDSVDIKPEVAVTKLAGTTTNLQQYTSATSPISSQCNASSSVPLSACGRPVPEISPGLEAELTAAVVAAIMKSNEQGSLIDMDLLVKIFNDPIMIEKLIKEHRIAAATVSASSNSVGIPTSGLQSATSVPMSKATTPEEAACGTTPTSIVGLLPSKSKQATPMASLFTPAPNKPAGTSVSMLTSALHNPAGKSTTLPVTSPTPPLPPPPTSAHLKHVHVNKNIHMSDGVLHTLNTHPPQQDTLMSYGVNRAATLPSISSGERSMPSATVNLHAVASHMRSTASTVPQYQPSIGSAFAVKDANYYKNLIKQHGTDKQDTHDSQIGLHHNNFEDFKSVHNNKTREMIFKNQKPCIFFKSSRGCRNGSICPYQHDMSVQWGAGNVLKTQNAKRFKLGPEIKGRT